MKNPRTLRTVVRALGCVVLAAGVALAAQAAPQRKAVKNETVRTAGKATAKPAGKTAAKAAAPSRFAPRMAKNRAGRPVRLASLPPNTVQVKPGARRAAYKVVKLKNGKRVRVARAPLRVEPPRPSFGQIYGLHNTSDPLELKSSVAYVLDQDTNEILVNKNSSAVLPIASITKLMTALVITDTHLPMDEPLTIAQEDVDTERGSRSRLVVGTMLSRADMLHLALMSSENRAAHALGRTYPGGMAAFVAAMNARAQSLGMLDTHYVEPTGLSSLNQSSARDLAALVRVAYAVPLLREMSTSPEAQVAVGERAVQFHSTNGLVRNPQWEIGLQKTGYISEAGRCLVMQASVAGRKLIMVLLDSAGKYSRIGDAERIRKWLAGTGEAATTSALPAKPAGSG